MPRPLGAPLAIAIASLVAGCSLLPAPPTPAANDAQAEIAAHRARWESLQLTSYRWRIGFACFCPTGTYDVTVTDGRVTKVLDADTGNAADPANVEFWPLTVPDVFDRAMQTAAKGTVIATWDPQTGVPTQLNLDPILNASDDELSITVSSLEPAP